MAPIEAAAEPVPVAEPRRFVPKSEPYPYPFDGQLTPQNTALIVIDMQASARPPGAGRRTLLFLFVLHSRGQLDASPTRRSTLSARAATWT